VGCDACGDAANYALPFADRLADLDASVRGAADHFADSHGHGREHVVVQASTRLRIDVEPFVPLNPR
jgi:hypothetical protein